ncbi:MAG: twin-arginine translocation signal domain-containing protein, partial [Gammaproteobacteria bacterium]|nr:twin-arginine translocation signal domain-containing protein [Gammaproteobacteria bacterium]
MSDSTTTPSRRDYLAMTSMGAASLAVASLPNPTHAEESKSQGEPK